jgi:hypothetical protein
MRIRLLFAATLLAACLPATAQSLKPGLWEIHNKMNNPEMDQAMAEMQKQMAAMPPAQRKQMEAAMAQHGVKMAGPGPGGGMVMQTCMTREMIERNDMPMQEGCRITKNQRSGNTLTMAFTCSNPPSSGEGKFTYTSDTAYTSQMTVRANVQGQAQTTTMNATGKWLKADCGNVKPVAAPRK